MSRAWDAEDDKTATLVAGVVEGGRPRSIDQIADEVGYPVDDIENVVAHMLTLGTLHVLEAGTGGADKLYGLSERALMPVVLLQPQTQRFHDVADVKLAAFQDAGLLALRVPYDAGAPAFMSDRSIDITFPPGTSVRTKIGGDFGPSRWVLPIGIVVEEPYMASPRLVGQPAVPWVQVKQTEHWSRGLLDAHVAAIRKEWGAVWPHIGRDLRSALVDARVTVALAGLDRETVAVTAIDALREALHRAMKTGGFAP